MMELDPSEIPGARCAVTLAMTRRWVNRRVETFAFLDADTVRRRMSIDLTLPSMSFLSEGATVFVPLMIIVKDDLRNLDVRDPDGRPLPVLNMGQNAAVVTCGIQGHLEGLLGRSSLDVELERLQGIIAERDKIGSAAAYLAPRGTIDTLLGKLSEQVAGEELRRLIEELESSFLLLVPFEYRSGRRIVCKVSYDAARTHKTRLRQEREGSWLGRVYGRFYAKILAWLAAFGLVRRTEVLDCVAFGLCESYHAEVVPPKDTYLTEASLMVCRAQGGELDEPLVDAHTFRSHLRAVPLSRGDTAQLTLRLHAHRQELLFPLAFSGVLISASIHRMAV